LANLENNLGNALKLLGIYYWKTLEMVRVCLE